MSVAVLFFPAWRSYAAVRDISNPTGLTSENFVKAVATSFNIHEKFNDAIQDKYGELDVLQESRFCKA